MSGKFELEYKYAKVHPQELVCKRLLELAELYSSHPDLPTLALVEAAASEVAKEKGLASRHFGR